MSGLIPIVAGSLLCALVHAPVAAVIIATVNSFSRKIGLPIIHKSFFACFISLWNTIWLCFTISFLLWFYIGPAFLSSESEIPLVFFCNFVLPALLLVYFVKPSTVQFVFLCMLFFPLYYFIFMHIGFVTFPPVGDPFYLDFRRLL
jgi:hypothetical protein